VGSDQAQARLGQDAPLQNTSKIRLGTLEKDFRDLEIVYTRDVNIAMRAMNEPRKALSCRR